MYSIQSAHKLYPRPRHPLSSGRADNACTNLLGYLVRYVRTRGMAEIVGSGKTADFRFIPCRMHSPRMARATNSCTRKKIFKRGELTNARSALVGVAETGVKALLNDYWYGDAVQRWLRHPEPSSWSNKSTIKEKLHYDSSLSEFFSLVRKERKGQKEERFPLLTSSVASRRPVRTKCSDRPAIAEPQLQARNA